MFKSFFQKTPLERAKDHNELLAKASTLFNNRASPSPSSSSSDSGHEDHSRFCQECEAKKNEFYRQATAAQNRGDTGEHDRLVRMAEQCDIDASNDLRRRRGY